MNLATFNALLKSLSDEDWQTLADGAGLLMVDDQRLATGPADAPTTVCRGEGGDAAQVRAQVLADAAGLLADYYRSRALTRPGFEAQVRTLFGDAAADFAAAPGERPRRTLFVDGGEVVAETRDSPRHPYGTYCELEAPLDATAAAARAEAWLTSGEAYEQYIGTNLCRYDC